MTNLLNKYRADKSLANARKLRTYDRQHPMAVCVLTREDAVLLAAAIHHANLDATNHANRIGGR